MQGFENLIREEFQKAAQDIANDNLNPLWGRVMEPGVKDGEVDSTGRWQWDTSKAEWVLRNVYKFAGGALIPTNPIHFTTQRGIVRHPYYLVRRRNRVPRPVQWKQSRKGMKHQTRKREKEAAV